MSFPYQVIQDVPFRDPLGQQDLYVRAGDRLPSFSAVIEDEFGRPVDLTGLTVFLAVRPESVSVVDQPVEWSIPRQITVVDPTAGTVFYDWQPGDLDVPAGVYEVQLTARDRDTGDLRTFPTRRMLRIIVRPEVRAGPEAP